MPNPPTTDSDQYVYINIEMAQYVAACAILGATVLTEPEVLERLRIAAPDEVQLTLMLLTLDQVLDDKVTVGDVVNVPKEEQRDRIRKHLLAVLDWSTGVAQILK